MVDPNTLQTLEVFSELDEADLQQLAHIVIEKQVGAGQPLFSQEMKGETLFVVLEGTVQVSRVLADGAESPLFEAEAGDFIGALSLFEPAERAVSAKTSEPSTLLIIRRKHLLALAEKAPKVAFQFAFELVRNQLERLRALGEFHAAQIEQASKLLEGR